MFAARVRWSRVSRVAGDVRPAVLSAKSQFILGDKEGGALTKWKIMVTLLLLSIASACLILWLGLAGTISDFGLNAATETLGILITVLIVDQLIKRHEDVRLLPKQAAAYEDVRLLTSLIVSFWADAYKACVPGAAPKSVEELFNKSSLDTICNNLNMDSQPKVMPAQTWWEWFPRNMMDFRKQAEIILERHKMIIFQNS